MERTDTRRLPNNVHGKYYTTEDCDGCAYCAMIAPENFDFHKETNTYFVSKQPTSPEEEELMEQLIEDCPIDAVRMDVQYLELERGLE